MKRINLPKGWHVVQFTDIAAKTRYPIGDGDHGSIKPSSYQNAGIPYIRVADITDGVIRKDKLVYIPEEVHRENSKSHLHPGDILISKTGATIGKVAILGEDMPQANTTASIGKLTVDPEKADNRYVFRYMETDTFQNQMWRVSIKSAQPGFNVKDLKSFQIILPPLPEQQRIASILDQADVIRKKRHQAIDELNTFIPAIFYDMFGDPANNPKRWNIKTLSFAAEVLADGPFGSNLKTSHYTESGVRVVRLQNIGVGEFIDKDKSFISQEHYHSLPRNHCRPGDVLIGTLGDPNLRACMLPVYISEALNKADCVLLRPLQKVVTPEYICCLLNMPGTLFLAKGLIHGQTRARISMGQLKNLLVPIPSIELQRDFAKNIEKTISLKIKCEKSASEVDDLFNSLVQRAFKGEL